MSENNISPTRQKGLDKMADVYGFEMQDGPGAYFAHTADVLFADVWSREDLSIRDRRLLLIGALTAQGNHDILDIQIGAALQRGDLTPEELEEAALFLCYYTGWPNGSKLNNVVGPHVKKARAQK